MVDLMNNPFTILFPGQGVQFAGMVNKLRNQPIAQEILLEGEKLLGFPIRSAMESGKAAVLDNTLYAQPAVFLASLAYLAVFRSHTAKLGLPSEPYAYCGHSLGQVTALVAANAIDFEAGLKFVAKRAEWMDEASRERPGLLAAVVGLSLEQTSEIRDQASQLGTIVIANYNGPQQYILSGEAAAIHKACELAENSGAKKVVILRITTASHSPLMQKAQDRLTEYLDSVSIRDALTPVVLNTSATLTRSSDWIRNELKNHLCQSVQWEKSMETLWNSGVRLFLDIGPGAVLEKMVQFQLPQAQTASLGFMQSMESLISASG